MGAAGTIIFYESSSFKPLEYSFKCFLSYRQLINLFPSLLLTLVFAMLQTAMDKFETNPEGLPVLPLTDRSEYVKNMLFLNLNEQPTTEQPMVSLNSCFPLSVQLIICRWSSWKCRGECPLSPWRDLGAILPLGWYGWVMSFMLCPYTCGKSNLWESPLYLFDVCSVLVSWIERCILWSNVESIFLFDDDSKAVRCRICSPIRAINKQENSLYR